MEDILVGFDTATADNWKSRLEKDLKGITFEQLSVVDDNGITINPFYTYEVKESSAPAFNHADWSILEKVVVRDEKAANEQALNALSTGASGLIFECTGADTDWAALLQGIELPYIYSFFKLKSGTAKEVLDLSAYLSATDTTSSLTLAGYDPLADYVASGEQTYKAAFEAYGVATLHKGQIVADGSIYYNAGANSTTQLGLITAQLNEYVQTLADQNSLDAIKQIHITVSVGTAFFEEIAKLRALRQLIDLLLAQYEIAPEVILQVQTGTLYKAPFDAYNNLLRDTLAGMAAVLGGADALYILPFDEGFSKGKDAFSKRMSINEQLLMKEESYLHQVADVANGSHYLDTLTMQFGEQAWAYFKHIENTGGFLAAFDKGLTTADIQTQAGILLEKYKSGARTWIGINKYPNSVDMPQTMEIELPQEGIISPLNMAALIIS
ncbi:hypothetical protein DBR32_05475 [Taibaiella sp. KBW10]|uniref:methylmalonyl-CoA mutase family protein n=1 Tax=Taibaiella sp. KBW10 TaxID=2153357 RepID=UPI000F5B488A|nr:methylmalonyl-CoA mutase family protein [Taibaiella sp. KBW10]RQO31414.1 hypothetical protein DBR32_05475 [Taibaiella sp. KBW10]